MKDPRCSKKARIDCCIESHDSNERFEDMVTSITLKQNTSIKDISNYKYLSILNLFDTKVDSITSCPVLHNLNITENAELKCLSLSSIQEFNINYASKVHTIDLESAHIVYINKLPVLKVLNLPNVHILNISNVNIHRNVLSFKPMAKLKILRLDNIVGMEGQDAIWRNNIDRLYINNCDIVTLSNVEGYRELVIRNCSQLQKVDSISRIDNIVIENCSSLKTIENCSDIITMNISKCNKFNDVSDIDLESLNIEYCFGLLHLESILVETLDVGFCPRIQNINVNPEMKYLVISNCSMLDSLLFECNSAFCYSTLKISLIGDNMIENIDEWYVSSLTVSDNRCLERISNIYNLTELSLVDCYELVTLSDTFIVDSLYTSNCPILESITNVYGYHNLDIIGCQDLIEMDVNHSKLLSLTIQECPQLNLHVNGQFLEQLTLIDTGFITIKDLDVAANIRTLRATMLPDLCSKPNRVGSLYNEATKKLINHMGRLFKSTKVIVDRIRMYSFRSKYLKFIEMRDSNRISDCVICQENISFDNMVITSCDHMYHSECINMWMRTKRVCPLCNYSL